MANVTINQAKREKNIQARIEKMQLEVLRGAVLLTDKAYIALEKELERFGKVRADLMALKVEPVSNYDALGEMLKELEHQNREELVAEFTAKAEAFKASIFGGPTKAQEEIIDAWFALQALRRWNALSGARSVYAYATGKTKDAREIMESIKMVRQQKAATEPAIAK